jgi:hypothetical protein
VELLQEGPFMSRFAVVRVLAVVGFLCPTKAYALPFELIVPRTVTINTSQSSGSGHVVWLAATDHVIDGARGASATLVADAVAGWAGHDVWGALVLVADAQGVGTGIQPGEVLAQEPLTNPLFADLVRPAEVLTSYPASGLFFHIWVHWPTGGYAGSYALDFAFLINPTDAGSDVARFTMDVTLDPTFRPTSVPSWEVHSAQRVTSVFDSGVVTRVPEPTTLSLAVMGFGYALAKASRRARRRQA